MSKFRYPFTAIVAQDEMKQALVLAAIDPSMGGVLILGERGTGKSTAVRALAQLLPKVQRVEGCAYNCAPEARAGLCALCGPDAGELPACGETPVPVVDLPLGASEDRVVGALDLEAALNRGEKVFEPGLLARANRGFLYIDEVNLLDDHLVDLLIDVAASGENLVEREGLSVRHPAQFVLVGSGNPEEGDLRPQLLDRFGLSVDVGTPASVEDRVEVVLRRDAFERDPQAFVKKWQRKESKLRKEILSARAALAQVDTGRDVLEDAAALCQTLGTDGLRGEITLMKAARALTAAQGGTKTTRAELLQIAPSVLRHRLRRNPLDDASSSTRVARAIADLFGSESAGA